MTNHNKLDLLIALHGQRHQLNDIDSALDILENDNEMDALRQQALAILGNTELPEPAHVEPLLIEAPLAKSWSEIVQIHEDRLKLERVNVENLTIDELLPASVLQEIEQAWDIWPEREKWRGASDYLIVAIAGTLGGVVDLFVDNITSQWGTTDAEKSRLKQGTQFFKELYGNDQVSPLTSHPIDARMPSDVLGGHRPDMHRAAGPTHDLCRIREALALMMGKETDFKVAGKSMVETYGHLLKMGTKGDAAKTFTTFDDPEQALAALLLHWYADFFSSRSLPIPGMSYLVDQGGTIRDITLELYKGGFNLRTLFTGLTRLSGVTLTNFILRIYFVLQRYRDGEQRLLVWNENRQIEMFLCAHMLSSTLGASAAALANNPALLNRGAMLAATRHAIALAYKVYKDKRDALDRFAQLAADNSRELDELLIRSLARPV